MYIYIYNFTGAIIVYRDSAVLYVPKITGPHSSGNFNESRIVEVA